MGKQDERKTLEARETVETVEQKFCSRLSPRHAPGYAGHVKICVDKNRRFFIYQTKPTSYLLVVNVLILLLVCCIFLISVPFLFCCTQIGVLQLALAWAYSLGLIQKDKNACFSKVDFLFLLKGI